LRVVPYIKEGGPWYTNEFKESMKVLKENDLLWEITVAVDTLHLAVQMVEEFPDNKFTFCHCGADRLGKFDEEMQGKYWGMISQMAKCKNVMVKTGSIEEWEVEIQPVLKHN